MKEEEAPPRPANEQHHHTIKKLQETGEHIRRNADACSRLSRTTLEFAPNKNEGKSGDKMPSYAQPTFGSKQNSQDKKSHNNSMMNINHLLSKITSPDLHADEGQLLDQFLSIKNLRLQRQLSPHQVNFALTAYSPSKNQRHQRLTLQNIELPKQAQNNSNSASKKDLGSVDNKRPAMLSTMQNLDAETQNQLQSDSKEILERHMRSMNSQISTPTSKSESKANAFLE